MISSLFRAGARLARTGGDDRTMFDAYARSNNLNRLERQSLRAGFDAERALIKRDGLEARQGKPLGSR